MGRKLAAAVYVTDPGSHQSVVLEAGTTPEKRLADLVTNPAAWDDDENTADETPEGDDAAESKPAAKKTAARKPARGRSAADEGDSGD